MLAVRRSLAALSLAPLALTGLAACGGDDSDSKTMTAEQAQGAGEPAADPGETVAPGEFVDRLENGFDAMTTAHLTMTMDSAQTGDITATGDLDYTGATPATAITMRMPMLSGAMDIRVVDGVIYMKMGQMSGGKFWKVDLNDPHNPLGSLGGQLDPKSSFEGLEKGLDKVTYVGQDDVDGEQSDHYRATVDTKEVLDKLAPGSSAQMPRGAMPRELDYDVWLDGQDRMTKMELDLGNIGALTMRMSDFGEDVEIEAPPSSQVTEMPELGGMGMPSTPTA